MRLRYLHLPRCGPLTDSSIVFGKDELISNALDLPRRGGLNFIVGVNGSGKSSILKALYRIFLSLHNRSVPEIPVTLAWDRMSGGENSTVILHYTNRKNQFSYVALSRPVENLLDKRVWQRIIESLNQEEPHSSLDIVDMIKGREALTSSLLFAKLPKRLIAYTSGDIVPWIQLDHPSFNSDEEGGEYQIDAERPQGWTIDLEWEKKQPEHIRKLLVQYGQETKGQEQTSPGIKSTASLPREAIARIFAELAPFNNLYQKVITNHTTLATHEDASCFIIAPQHLRYGAIIMGLWQAAKEMRGCRGEKAREQLRSSFISHHEAGEKADDARRILNEVDWFYPTHLSITYRNEEDRISPRQYQELFGLLALADEVVAQPLGMHRAIISLGAVDGLNLSAKVNEVFPLRVPNKDVEFMARRVDGCKTGAEAVLRVFSSDQDIDSTPMDVFSRLKDWERTGLLEEVTVTIKRLHQHETDYGELQDTIVTYDQLSDGEQMLLGRMGLLFLLRGQDGSLLLLDEPETHFNDVWKREIVEMIDMGLLNSTLANVIVATHTSIALTDAFAAEVTVMDKRETGITARSVKGGLFGTDPGEVNINLFRADSSTGRRSVELLEKLLQTEWKGREDELEAILNVLGSSFHRAELRAVLKDLRKK